MIVIFFMLFIGQKYAITNLKILLANLLRRFEFSLPDPTAPLIEPVLGIVLKPLDGLPLVVKRRTISRT